MKNDPTSAGAGAPGTVSGVRTRRGIGTWCVVMGVAGLAGFLLLRPKPELKWEGKPVSEWAREMNDARLNEAASEAFEEMGAEAVPDLIRALRRSGSIWRRSFYRGVAKLPDGWRTRLISHFRPYEVVVQKVGAARALQKLGPAAEPAIPVLTNLLQSGDRSLSVQAALTLGTIGSNSVPALIECMQSSDPYVRSMCVYSLGLIGPDAAQASAILARALTDQKSISQQAIQALARLGRPAVPKILRLLNSPETKVRIAAVQSLGMMASGGRPAIPALISCLSDPDAEVRLNAAFSLGTIRPGGSNVVSALALALADPHRLVQINAAHGLVRAGRLAAPAWPALARNLASPDPEVRAAAARALASIGPGAIGAVPDLEPLVEDVSAEVRKNAVTALEAIRANPEGTPAGTTWPARGLP